MENASKAIIMVAGVIIALLLVALLNYAWTLFGEYQEEQDELTDVEDVSKFNEQFSNYDRKDVQGYEIISLANKVADYNNRYASTSSTNEGATGTGSYSSITLTIHLVGRDGNDYRYDLAYDNTIIQLFDDYDTYVQGITSASNKNVFTRIYDIATGIESEFGSSSNATRVAKAIGQIFYSVDDEEDEEVIKKSMEKYNTCVSTSNKITTIVEAENKLAIGSDFYKYAIQYYEYMQFKTLEFECCDENGEAGITYDATTNRVVAMTFYCTGFTD